MPTLAVRPSHVLLATMCLLAMLPMLSALLVDRLGLALTPRSTAGAALCLLLVLGSAVAVAQRRLAPRLLRLPWAVAETAVLLAAFVGSLSYLLWLANAALLPVGTSVDGGWHYGLVDHILEVQRLGVSHERLGDVDSYTPGYHLLVVVAALWSGYEPIYLLYPASALLFALGLAATVQIAMDVTPAGPWRPLIGLGAPVALMLLPSRYTIEIITGQNFYPTAAGLAWLLVAGWAAGLLHRSDRYSAWALLAVGVLGVIISYPFWLPTALGLLLALVIARCWGRWRRLGLELLLTSAVLALGLALVHDLLSDQLRQVSWRMPALSAAHLVVLALLITGGLYLSRRLRDRAWLPVAVLGVLLMAQFAALSGRESYLGQKLLYAVPYATVGLGAAAWGLALQQARARGGRWVIAGALFIVLAGFAALQLQRGELRWVVERPFHPLSPEQAEVALWVRDNIAPDPDQVAYVLDYNITAYWIKVGILRSLRGWSARSVLEYPLPRYSYWATDPAVKPYAFVDNAEPQLVGPAAKLLHRRDAVRFLQRGEHAAEDEGRVYIQAYTTLEPFADLQTVRTAAYASGLPNGAYRLWFFLTPRAGGDVPAEELWRRPLDARRSGDVRYGLVRLDLSKPAALIWQDGRPRPADFPALAPGTAVSGWIQLTHRDQPVATRRIYDLVSGDPASLRLRDHNPNSIFSWAPRAEELPEPAHELQVELGGRVRLERWELETPKPARGEPATLAVQWRSLRAVEPPARIFVHLLGSDGASHSIYDGEPQGGFYPFWLWPQQQRVRDRYTLAIPADIAAGTYDLIIGIYNPMTGQRWPAASSAGEPRESAVRLGRIELRE